MTNSTSAKIIFLALLVTWATDVTADEILHTNAGVAASREVVSKMYSKRIKKDLDKGRSGFTSQEKTVIVDYHNKLRRQRNSSDMIKLVWLDAIEKIAQNWAQQCRNEPSPEQGRKNISGYKTIGENMFASADTLDPTKFIQTWYDEEPFYQYTIGTCQQEKTCAHYTQVVWAESRKIGCGIKYCDKITNDSNGELIGGYNVVCNYAPGGNTMSKKPFKVGDACVWCPIEIIRCVGSLCEESVPDIEDMADILEQGIPLSGMVFLSLVVPWFV